MFSKESGEQDSPQQIPKGAVEAVSQQPQRPNLEVVNDAEAAFVKKLQAALTKSKDNKLSKAPEVGSLKDLAAALAGDQNSKRFTRVVKAVETISKDAGVDPKKVARQVVKVSREVFGEKVDRSWTSKAVCAAALVAVFNGLKDIADIERLAVLSRIPEAHQTKVFTSGAIGDVDIRTSPRQDVQDAVKALKGSKKEPDKTARLILARKAVQKALEQICDLPGEDAREVVECADALIKKIEAALKPQEPHPAA